MVRLLDVERVVIAFSNDSAEQTLELVRSLNELQVQVDIVPRLFELVGPERQDRHRRGAASRRAAAAAPLALVPLGQALDRHRRWRPSRSC